MWIAYLPFKNSGVHWSLKLVTIKFGWSIRFKKKCKLQIIISPFLCKYLTSIFCCRCIFKATHFNTTIFLPALYVFFFCCDYANLSTVWPINILLFFFPKRQMHSSWITVLQPYALNISAYLEFRMAWCIPTKSYELIFELLILLYLHDP